MPHSGELGSQHAVSRKEQLRLLLLSAVSRNQAALASDQNERQRLLLTGNPTTTAGEKRGFLQAGRRRAGRRAGRADEGTPPRGPGGQGTRACAGRMESCLQRHSAAAPRRLGGRYPGCTVVPWGWWSAARRGVRAWGRCTAHKPRNFTLKRLRRSRSSLLIKSQTLTSGARGEQDISGAS
jgi:hypothetical protein